MTTSKNGTALAEPSGADRVPLGTFGYFQARNKYNAYDIAISEFEKSGLSQADLARRLGKGTDQVCRLLGGPGNWTLDTFSDVLFAISGAAPVFNVEYPLRKPARNQLGPEWIYDDTVVIKKTLDRHEDVTSKVIDIENRPVSVSQRST